MHQTRTALQRQCWLVKEQPARFHILTLPLNHAEGFAYRITNKCGKATVSQHVFMIPHWSPPKKLQQNSANAKEQKWGKCCDGVVKCISVLEGEGWTVVYTDGSAERVKGWWQAGYGAWFGAGSARNVGARVLMWELRGVLYALPERPGGGGHMVVVLDSEYVFKGVIEWSPKWKRHSWRSKSTEIGHQDLWQEIWQLHAAGCMAAGADNLDCLGHLCGEGGTAWTSSHRPHFV